MIRVQDLALRHGSGHDRTQRLGRHDDEPLRDCLALRRGLLSDIDHLCPALLIQMRQPLAHAAIIRPRDQVTKKTRGFGHNFPQGCACMVNSGWRKVYQKSGKNRDGTVRSAPIHRGRATTA